MKVLIIDDSGVMRRIHSNTLKEHGVDAGDLREAEDGTVALDIAERDDIDLFLVDWNMPKLDGLGPVKSCAQSPSTWKRRTRSGSQLRRYLESPWSSSRGSASILWESGSIRTASATHRSGCSSRFSCSKPPTRLLDGHSPPGESCPKD